MAKQDELELEEGGKNNPHDDRRKQLYAQADEDRENNQDFTDVQDEDFDKTAEISEEADETKTEPKTQDVPKEEPKKYKIKVNGKDVELTEEEMLERASKSEAANQKFEEAARLRREVDEKLKQLPVKTDAAQPQVTDDDLALARALQMGDEKEAAAVIARLRKPALQLDQVSRLVDERVSFQSSVDAFKEEFPDIAGDPYLWEIAQDKDAKLVAGGDTRPYFDRYKAIGDDLRNWLKAKAPNPSEKQARKAAVPAPVKSGMRAEAPAEDDRDESPSDIIAKMAAKRGQGYGGNV
jgi:hypothetical protein